MSDVDHIKTYSQEEIKALLSQIEQTHINVAATSDTIVAKFHELNVSSKSQLNVSKSEVEDILQSFIMFNAIIYHQAEFFENLIRQMAPSLKFARDSQMFDSDRRTTTLTQSVVGGAP